MSGDRRQLNRREFFRFSLRCMGDFLGGLYGAFEFSVPLFLSQCEF